MARGSLCEVAKPCVREGCADCARGDKHPSFIFSYRKDGKQRCLYVPRELVGPLRRSESSQLSLVIFDVDHFKDINEKYGHLGGDVVLRRVGALLAQESSGFGLAARFGADEFAVILAGVCQAECVAFADRIREAVGAIRFEQTMSTLTLSVSAAVVEHHAGESFQDVIQRADGALHEAKRGRRTVAG